MKPRAFFLAIFAIPTFWQQIAKADPVETSKSIRCGGTMFRMTTLHRDMVVTTQRLVATPSHDRSRSVDLRESAIHLHREFPGTTGVPAFVYQWQCRKTQAGHVLVLGYMCPQVYADPVPARFCSVTGEWDRYIATDGSLLDAGYGLDDPREAALRARLGYHDNPPDQVSDDGPFIDLDE